MRSIAHGPARLPAWAYDRQRWRLVSTEILGTAAIMVVYFLLRGMRPDVVHESVVRSLQVVHLEQRLGIFMEVDFQEAFIDQPVPMTIANFVYAWGHYPVLLAIALWLVVKDPVRFRFVRNVLLVSAAIGVLCYWVLPTAPPRLMAMHGYDFGFIDTVHGATSDVPYFQPDPFVNDYAALPSFHFGWILLATLAIWVNVTSKVIRALAVAMSVVMFWAITVTGNHYFVDMAFGAVVIVVSWIAVDAAARLRRRLAVRNVDTGTPLPEA